MANLFRTSVFLLLLSNPLLAASVTMLEVGHFDVVGGPLDLAAGSRGEMAAGFLCELLMIAPDGAVSTAAEFTLSADSKLDTPGYFLSDWFAVEYAAGCELFLRLYPHSGEREAYFESPRTILQPGRQQIGFATADWTYHAAANSRTQPQAPQRFGLSPAYPNPFNATATVEFELAAAAQVHLELFNLLGQRVQLIVDDTLPEGRHRRQLDGSRLATGIYLLRMSTSTGFSASRKLTLLK